MFRMESLALVTITIAAVMTVAFKVSLKFSYIPNKALYIEFLICFCNLGNLF